MRNDFLGLFTIKRFQLALSHFAFSIYCPGADIVVRGWGAARRLCAAPNAGPLTPTGWRNSAGGSSEICIHYTVRANTQPLSSAGRSACPASTLTFCKQFQTSPGPRLRDTAQRRPTRSAASHSSPSRPSRLRGARRSSAGRPAVACRSDAAGVGGVCVCCGVDWRLGRPVDACRRGAEDSRQLTVTAG